MTLRERDETWELYDRDENDFPRPSRGYEREDVEELDAPNGAFEEEL